VTGGGVRNVRRLRWGTGQFAKIHGCANQGRQSEAEKKYSEKRDGLNACKSVGRGGAWLFNSVVH